MLRKEKTAQIRGQQEYPFILVDYTSDVQRIDRVISNDSCAVAFDSEGYVYTDTGKWQGSPYNIRCIDLRNILENVTKKIIWAGYGSETPYPVFISSCSSTPSAVLHILPAPYNSSLKASVSWI